MGRSEWDFSLPFVMIMVKYTLSRSGELQGLIHLQLKLILGLMPNISHKRVNVLVPATEQDGKGRLGRAWD